MDLLLIIRGLAAIAVLVWHTVGYQGGLPLINIPGRVAVWIFFGISGYVISYGFIKNKYQLTESSLRYFYLNRVLRIYPLFLFLSFLGYFTILLKTGASPIGWSDLPKQLLALQFNHEYSLNGVFWTLGLEIQFYLLAPILVVPLLISKAQFRWAISMFVYFACLIIIEYATSRVGWSFDGRNIVMVLPHFLAGMIGCRLVADGRPAFMRPWTALGGAFLLLLSADWFYHERPEIFWSIKGILIIDAMILFLIVGHAGLEGQVHKRSRFARQLEWLGIVSYGIYAWHAYFMASFDWLNGRIIPLGAVTLLASYMTYRFLELPALRLKKWQK